MPKERKRRKKFCFFVPFLPFSTICCHLWFLLHISMEPQGRVWHWKHCAFTFGFVRFYFPLCTPMVSNLGLFVVSRRYRWRWSNCWLIYFTLWKWKKQNLKLSEMHSMGKLLFKFSEWIIPFGFKMVFFSLKWSRIFFESCRKKRRRKSIYWTALVFILREKHIHKCKKGSTGYFFHVASNKIKEL